MGRDLEREEMKRQILRAPNIANMVQESLDNLQLEPEFAGLAELALYVADTLDSADSEFNPIDLDYEAEHDTPLEWRNLKQRVRNLQKTASRMRAIEKCMPSLLTALREMGATPGPRARAAEPAKGGRSDEPSELDRIRAERARRAG